MMRLRALRAGFLAAFVGLSVRLSAQTPPPQPTWVVAVEEVRDQMLAIAEPVATVAVVIVGLQAMFGEQGVSRRVWDIIYGAGMAVGASAFVAWLT